MFRYETAELPPGEARLLKVDASRPALLASKDDSQRRSPGVLPDGEASELRQGPSGLCLGTVKRHLSVLRKKSMETLLVPLDSLVFAFFTLPPLFSLGIVSPPSPVVRHGYLLAGA